MSPKPKKNRSSANELYNVYTVSEKLYKYKKNIKITEGISDLATYEDCFWLLDTILEYSPKIDCEFQIWDLERTEQSKFILKCTNSEKILVFEIEIFNKNFYFDDLKVIKKKNRFYLPIEVNM